MRTKENKKSVGRIIRSIILGILGVCIFVVIGFYVAGMVHFKDRFFLNTVINGVDVSEWTVEQAEAYVAEQVGTYQLKIEERGEKSEVITAGDIDYHFVSRGEIRAFMDGQKIYAWPLCFWKSTTYSFDSGTQYDEALLTEAIGKLECLNESSSVAPKDAYIDFLEGSYQVVPEVEGNLLVKDKTEQLIREAVDSGNRTLSLEEKNCYQIPNKRKNDAVMNATCDKLNRYISTDIEYLFGDRSEILNGERIRPWLSYDEEGNVSMDKDQVYEYVYQLAQKYDTVDKPREFVTHGGNTVSVEGGYYGWLIDQEAEVSELIPAIENGTQGIRYAVFAQTAVSWENSDLGDTYVEVDLSGQHVWLYVNGEEVVSTDCVSGTMSKPDCVTPPGTYTLYYKESPSVLKGENNEYESKVTYWMPFNGGIGLHDAVWRSSFGGEIYKTSGSHGCINLPLEAAAQIYERVYDGIPIICYY